MTVNFNPPYNQFIADGVITEYSYTFKALEPEDVYVWIDSELQIEFSHYTIENFTAAGGDVVFEDPPAADAVVTILRRTPITQQVDYVDSTAFPAETHELGADKLILILQEFIYGVATPDDIGAEVDYDLAVQVAETTITILNNAGTDAVIPPWDSGEDAGAFMGEITEAAPADDTATAKPDGYMWIEVLPTP